MLTMSDFQTALDSLDLENKPAIAHASIRSFGDIQGGAETVLKALLSSLSSLVMPTFTYKTMVIPEVGPPNNGLSYGTQVDLNRMAVPFHLYMPADSLMGVLPEVLRKYPGVQRTAHPILSFAGINANDAMVTQNIFNPFALIGALAGQDGWVLLLGVDQTVNTSIHYGERLAGRHQFVRWALTQKRIVECSGYPGCSEGFGAIRHELEHVTRREQVGSSYIEAIPLQPLLEVVKTMIKSDPLALLCQREVCERCDTVRVTVKVAGN